MIRANTSPGCDRARKIAESYTSFAGPPPVKSYVLFVGTTTIEGPDTWSPGPIIAVPSRSGFYQNEPSYTLICAPLAEIETTMDEPDLIDSLKKQVKLADAEGGIAFVACDMDGDWCTGRAYFPRGKVGIA